MFSYKENSIFCFFECQKRRSNKRHFCSCFCSFEVVDGHTGGHNERIFFSNPIRKFKIFKYKSKTFIILGLECYAWAKHRDRLYHLRHRVLTFGNRAQKQLCKSRFFICLKKWSVIARSVNKFVNTFGLNMVRISSIDRRNQNKSETLTTGMLVRVQRLVLSKVEGSETGG